MWEVGFAGGYKALFGDVTGEEVVGASWWGSRAVRLVVL